MRGRREGRDNRRVFYRNKLIATMIIVMGVVISINSADNKTEFGVMDDFTVWGVEGTLDDPDLEIKGFSVFGATQTAYTANITNGPGNVMINGVLGVSSGAYIAGISTISYIANINTTSMTITGNGITGSSPIFKVANSTMVILNDGRVGIGTMNPNATLSITKTGSSLSGTAASSVLNTMAGSLGITAGNTLKLASIGFNSSNQSSLGIEALRTANGTSWETTAIGLKMDVDDTSPVGNSQIWMTASGNVGISTTTPQQKLDIQGNLALGTGNVATANPNNGLSIRGATSNFNLNIQDGSGRVNYLWNATAGGGTYIVSNEPAARILETVNGTTGGYFGFYGAAAGTAGNSISWTQIAELSSASDIWLSPRGTNSDFYINNYGNVGIGTTDPANKLQIANGDLRVGEINPVNTDTFPGYGRIIYFSGGPAGATYNSDNSDPLWLARYNVASDKTELRINIGDNADAGDKLNIGYTGSSFTSLAVVQANGNVGIGTTSPNKKVEINGTLGFTGGTGPFCIFANSCPNGWIDKGQGGYIYDLTGGATCPYSGGASYNSSWYWCHPKICCNQ